MPKLRLAGLCLAGLLATRCEPFGGEEPTPAPVDPTRPSADAGPGAEAGAVGFCARNADALACRDFDDRDDDPRLLTTADSVDTGAIFRVVPAAEAPSEPNVLLTEGNGGSLEAFGVLATTSTPTVVAFAMRVRRFGTRGEVARLAYGRDLLGLRIKPGSTVWQVFASTDGVRTGLADIPAPENAWVSVEYRIANGNSLTVLVGGVEVATDRPIPAVNAGGVRFFVGIGETEGPWTVELDDVVLR